MSRTISPENRAFVAALVDKQIASLVHVRAWAVFDVGVAQAIMRAERESLIEAAIVAWNAPSVLLPAAARAVQEAIQHAAGPLH